MPFIQRVVKPTTRRGKRFLESKEPKLEEDVKKSIFVRGATSSNVVLSAAKDLNKLKQPNSVFFNKKNDIKPFEDPTSLEFFALKNDSSLFTFTSHNKKRPHNLIMGRIYDNHLLDMMEFGVENFTPISDFKVEKVASGIKPMVVFTGEPFDNEPVYKRIKNYFLDFFRGPKAEAIRLQGLEHVIQFTALDGKINFRSYRVLLKKSGSKLPRVELEEIGPRMDFNLRRHKLASDGLFKLACKQPKQLKVKKVKNIKRNPLGSTMGRIHMERQDYKRLQTRKMKGLKKSLAEKKELRQKKKNNPNLIPLSGDRTSSRSVKKPKGGNAKGAGKGKKRQMFEQHQSKKRVRFQ